MKKTRVPALLAVILWVAGLAAQAPDNARFSRIEEIVGELSRITGLARLRPVEYDTIDRAGLKQFLQERLKEVAKPEELRAEELALKKFGFVPPDFDLGKSTVDLLTEQAAAFYDFKKARLFLLDSGSSALQQTALVHELAHALADQHFRLEKFIERAGKSDDSSLARMAVMEGQATWLMSEYAARRLGQSLATSPEMVRTMTSATNAGAGQFPVFQESPLYMRESLLFPYTRGMLFQHAVFKEIGKEAFAEVFRHPPVSSQHILHPEKYFARVKPSAPKVPEAPNARQYEKLMEGTVGEFDHAILLRQYAGSEAEPLAVRWKGGTYRLVEHKKNKRVLLAYASEWESESAARDFFRLYREVLAGKWKKLEVRKESEDTLAGEGDDGHFVVRWIGPRVTSLEGLEDPEDAREAHLR